MPGAEEIIREANAAARLLNDELLNEVLDQIESGYIEDFRARKSEPPDAKLFWQLHAVADIRKELRTKLDRGSVEAKRLEDEENRRLANRPR